MIKLRAMGTTGDLKRLNRLIDRLEDIEVISRSDIMSSVGTNRYYREYMDVEITDGDGAGIVTHEEQ